MPWASTVPAAIGALVSTLTAEPALGALVHDQDDLRNTGNEAVFVGYAGDDDAIVAEGSFRRDGLAVDPSREQYSIRCSIGVLNGANSTANARARTYELFAVVGKSLAADKTLGGVVLSASLGDWSFSVPETDAGAVSTLTFNVEIDAYTTL